MKFKTRYLCLISVIGFSCHTCYRINYGAQCNSTMAVNIYDASAQEKRTLKSKKRAAKIN